MSKVARNLFRAQLGHESVKRRRWWVETDLQAKLTTGEVTRNSLINEPVVTLDDCDPTRTKILHEYFIEPSRFADWVDLCKRMILGSYQELFNITLRYVAPPEILQDLPMLASLERQGYDDLRWLVNVQLSNLSTVICALEGSDATLEHIFDY